MTLIEVLICIFVMGTGILAIARLMTYNISTIATVHDQLTATTLAREWLEMLSNVRDTNKIIWYERNCAKRMTQTEIDALSSQDNTNSLCKEFFWTGSVAETETTGLFTIDGGLLDIENQIIMKKITNTTNLFSGWQLYLTWFEINWVTISGYTHNITNNTSRFSRYLEFTSMKYLSNTSAITIQNIHPVRSVVLYNRNGNIKEIALESFIANKE